MILCTIPNAGCPDDDPDCTPSVSINCAMTDVKVQQMIPHPTQDQFSCTGDAILLNVALVSILLLVQYHVQLMVADDCRKVVDHVEDGQKI